MKLTCFHGCLYSGMGVNQKEDVRGIPQNVFLMLNQKCIYTIIALKYSLYGAFQL